MPTIAKVHLILDHKAAIAGSFHISLVKPALVPVDALAPAIYAAVIGALGCATVEIIPGVNVLTAAWSVAGSFAIAFAGQRRDGAARVDDQTLFLFMAPDVHVDVEILQIGGVTRQSCALNVNME